MLLGEAWIQCVAMGGMDTVCCLLCAVQDVAQAKCRTDLPLRQSRAQVWPEPCDRERAAVSRSCDLLHVRYATGKRVQTTHAHTISDMPRACTRAPGLAHANTQC